MSKMTTPLLVTYGEIFKLWWNFYNASKGNEGLIKRDYAFLDIIVPETTKSLEE